MQTFEKICDIIKNYIITDENLKLNENTTLQSIGADSLDTVEIIMEIEDFFDIEIEEEKENKIHNLGDLVNLVNELVTK